MATTRASLADLVTPGFYEIFFNKYKGIPEVAPSLFNIIPSKKKKEMYSEIGGLGLVPEADEGSDITYDDVQQAYDVTIIQKSWRLATKITQEMFDDDLYQVLTLPKVSFSFAMSIKATMETQHANILNRAFAPAYTGGDSLELCSLSHPLTGGGTEQNELTTPADLVPTSLSEAIQFMKDTLDIRGVYPIGLQPQYLLVPTALETTAHEILDSTQKAYTANNEINVMKQVGLKIIVWPYLTDSDAWFLLTAKEFHGLISQVSREPRITTEDDFDTESVKIKTFFRKVPGFIGWPGVFGSPGA